MKSIDKFSKYSQAYNNVIMPNIPIIIHAEISNFNKLTRKLKPQPFCQELYDILSKTLFSCSMLLEGAIFSFHTFDEFTFILNGSSNAYNNNIQELISVTSSYLSTWFIKNYFVLAETMPEFIGDAIFSTNAFAVPNYREVINYLIWRQHIGNKNDKRFGSAAYKVPKLVNELIKKKWYLNNEIPLFKENKELIYNILKSGCDIYRPERDL